MNDTRYALAELTQRLIGMVLSPIGLGFFALPLLTLRWIIRFLRWGVSMGRGGDDLEEMQAEYYRQRERGSQLRQQARSTFRRRY